MSVEKADDAAALLVEVLRAFPGIQSLGLGQQGRELRAGCGGMRRVVARKDQARHRATSREIAGDAEYEVTVPHVASKGLHVRSDTSSFHVADLHTIPSVVIASEELDGEDGWRMLAPGELVHVRPDLSVQSAVVLDEPPARPVPLPAQNPNIDT